MGRKPGRASLGKIGKGREQGAVVKRQKVLVRTALIYPNTYQAGMSSLGFQTVYRLINDLETVACERVFLPAGRRGRQPVKSVETGLLLDEFDLLAFSVSFENDYPNIAWFLRQAGLPLASSERTSSHPLVIAGGVACFLNPEPLSMFVDLFLVGEAEGLIARFFDHLDLKRGRKELLLDLAKNVPGVYVPGFYRPEYDEKGHYRTYQVLMPGIPERIAVQRVADLSGMSTQSSIVCSNTAFDNTVLIETGRGCHHGCRFCSAGFIYRPPRFYRQSDLENALDETVGRSPRVGLVGAAVSDHPSIAGLCKKAQDNDLSLGFSSLRADALDDILIESLAASGVKTATLAPEAGSKRMRSIINKHLTGEHILSAAERLVSAGILNLKLYFMIGLPLETDDDVQEIVDLTLAVRERFVEASRNNKRIGTLTLSLNPFIPKPFTPFQWFPMEDIPVLKRRLQLIRSGLKQYANLVLNVESLRLSRINWLLSCGDRRLGPLIAQAAQDGWSRTLSRAGSQVDSILPRYRSLEDPLPWDILDTGLKPQFLAREYRRAVDENQSSECPMMDCSDCRRCR